MFPPIDWEDCSLHDRNGSLVGNGLTPLVACGNQWMRQATKASIGIGETRTQKEKAFRKIIRAGWGEGEWAWKSYNQGPWRRVEPDLIIGSQVGFFNAWTTTIVLQVGPEPSMRTTPDHWSWPISFLLLFPSPFSFSSPLFFCVPRLCYFATKVFVCNPCLNHSCGLLTLVVGFF